MGEHSLCLHRLPFQQSASEEEGRRSAEDRLVSSPRSGTPARRLKHTHVHALAGPLRWNSTLSIPTSSRTLHSITAKPELQNRVQMSKRKSQNLRAQCAVANFLLSWIIVSERSAGLLRNIRHRAHTDMDTHRAHTHKSITQLAQILRTNSPTQSNLETLLCRTLTDTQAAHYYTLFSNDKSQSLKIDESIICLFDLCLSCRFISLIPNHSTV